MTRLVSVRSFPLIDGKRVLPPGVVYIGRAVPRVGLKASRWANPYRPTDKRLDWSGDEYLIGAAGAARMYVQELLDRLEKDPWLLEPLRGKTLACWCDDPEYCHGSVILRELEWRRPLAVPGQRIEFGIHAMPQDEAEAAEAWPSLNRVKWAADARFRREQRKAGAR